jgi:hypothetical protein
MVSSLEVMNQLFRYLQGEQNAQALRHWMVGAQLQNGDGADKLADRLISEMDSLFAQLSDGIVPESFVRKEFSKLLLSDRSMTPSIQIQYSFLRPSFANPLPKTDSVASSETASTTRPNELPDTRQLCVAA